MRLQALRMIAWALDLEGQGGPTACDPRAALSAWEYINKARDEQELIYSLGEPTRSKLHNYLLLWGGKLEGLPDAGAAALPAEAKNAGSPQSEKSESVVIGADDVGRGEDVLL